MTLPGRCPRWLTFDCYGTLIQWDEGLKAAANKILSTHIASEIDAAALLARFDLHEHALEQDVPHRSFRQVAGLALDKALRDLGIVPGAGDVDILTRSIGAMPPFPETVHVLGALKAAGFSLAIISNTDDDIIAGNVAQLGGHIDRVFTAEQAQAYKPSRRIFEHAWNTLGVSREEVFHICASPQLDLVAARDLGFRAVWIDRGTGRSPLPDYRPEATLPTLEGVPELFARTAWLAN